MNTRKFEDNRWSLNDQKIVFRHRAALDMIDNGKVLDLGCGDGLFLKMLQEKNVEGFGLDISNEAVEKSQKKGIKAELFDFTQERLPFGDNYFDHVVMLDVLEHLYFPEKLLREAQRVSKKFVIIGVPNFNSLPARLQVLFGRTPENNRPNKGHVFWFNLSVLRSMLKTTNLIVVEYRVNGIWCSRKIIGSIMKFFSTKFPSLFALSFVIKSQKIESL